MRDVFGADAPATDGTPAAISPAAQAAAATAAAAPGAVAAPKPPTLAQAAEKAVAKAAADLKVATDPQATHAVTLAAVHPNVLGATLAGAAIGSALPVVGTLLGAAIGFVSSKYQIGGDPLGKAVSKVVEVAKTGYQKAVAPGQLPKIGLKK